MAIKLTVTYSGTNTILLWKMATEMSEISKNGVSCPKKARLDNVSKELNDSVHETIKDLSEFKVEKVLSNNSNRKSVTLQGSFVERDGVAIVLLEKTAFTQKHVERDSEYFSDKSTLTKSFHNDIYGNYECLTKPEINNIKATIIHPATEKHIQKYSVQNAFIVDETPDVYSSVTLPHIESEQFNLQWLYNIQEHKSETDRIAFEDSDPENGFILLPDLKWDGKTLETLYLLAIANIRGIKSLRDLNGDHLGLLKNIKAKGTKAIEEKYGLKSTQLRVYLHYQPSFYHLHVHFVYLRHEAPGIYAEKAHMLSNVISNIELLSDYYKKVTLPFVVRETQNLYKKLTEKQLL